MSKVLWCIVFVAVCAVAGCGTVTPKSAMKKPEKEQPKKVQPDPTAYKFQKFLIDNRMLAEVVATHKEGKFLRVIVMGNKTHERVWAAPLMTEYDEDTVEPIVVGDIVRITTVVVGTPTEPKTKVVIVKVLDELDLLLEAKKVWDE